MPALSEKDIEIRCLELLLHYSVLHPEVLPFPLNQPQVLLSALVEVHTTRYSIPRTVVPKSREWLENTLPLYTEQHFKRNFRLSRASFTAIVELLKTNPKTNVFFQSKTIPQAPIEEQLLFALWRLGHRGKAAGPLPLAQKLGRSEGFVHNCTKRVVTALSSIKTDVVRWPDREKRLLESRENDARAGFAGAIGKVDGTHVVFELKPGGILDTPSYLNRKGSYSTNVLAICDSTSKFTFFEVGWPGSVHDQRIYAESDLGMDPSKFFSEGEYVIADSAYASTSTVVPAFKGAEANRDNNNIFNNLLSDVRIDIKHACGILKARFPSLNGLRLQLQTLNHYQYAVRWICACFVLHNLLLDFGDTYERNLVEDENDKYVAVASDEEVSGTSDEEVSVASDEEASGTSDEEVTMASDEEVSGTSDEDVTMASDEEVSGTSDEDDTSDEMVYDDADTPDSSGIDRRSLVKDRVLEKYFRNRR